MDAVTTDSSFFPAVMVVGLNHRSAPVAIRERLAFPDGKVAEALRAMHRKALREAVILFTCNRTEFYGVAASSEDGVQAVKDFLEGAQGLPLAAVQPYLYSYSTVEAARHLFRVACGLDSMILGEGQILGQVRSAFARAQAVGSVGKVLGALFAAALRAGKRARRQTGISTGAVSVGQAAVVLSKTLFGGLEQRRVLVVGAGKMGRLALQGLVQARAGEVFIANRTRARAEHLAQFFGAQVVDFEDFSQALGEVDLLLTCTAAPHPILAVETLRRLFQERPAWPLVCIDIGVPRNIDPQARSLPYVTVYDIDDLRNIALDNLRLREQKVAQVEQIIEEELEGFLAWAQADRAAGAVRAFQELADGICNEELKQSLGKLGALGDEQRHALELLVHRLRNRLVHHPLLWLKEYAARDDGASPFLAEIEERMMAATEAHRRVPTAGSIRKDKQRGRNDA